MSTTTKKYYCDSGKCIDRTGRTRSATGRGIEIFRVRVWVGDGDAKPQEHENDAQIDWLPGSYDPSQS
ncbi:hypothetical protein FE257_000402 [Aspergillus nanangensis]|uniref:Uncharacterized protein n=1 Tax=Aspergillus nanangensis TaxID=2582783 RepID=A0AAD4GYN5_ASPNN|nr:hypothetical protein FE257_000402 [Aspergillus nanangensis]